MVNCNNTVNNKFNKKKARDLILSRFPIVDLSCPTSHGHSRLIIVRLSITPDRNRNFVPEKGQDSAEK